MHTTITARHCDISEELRQRAEAVLQRLGGLAARPVDGTVVFDLGPSSHSAEVRLHVAKGDLFVATGEGSDHRSALDRAEDKIRHQIDRDPHQARRSRRTEADKA